MTSKSDEALLLRNAALAGLIRGEPLGGILELIALSIEAEVCGWQCAIMIANEAGTLLRVGAAPRLPEAYRAAIDNLPIGDGIGACGTAASRRSRIVSENVATDPLWQAFTNLAQLGGFAACWSEPIIGPEGELLGTFSAYAAQPDRPDKAQCELLQQASQLTALILAHERNARRLQSSHETFSGIFHSVSEALLILDEQDHFLAVNQRAEELFGRSAGELLRCTPGDLAADCQDLGCDIDACIRKAFAGTPQHLEYRGKRPNGDIFPLEILLHAGVYFGQPAVIASALDISERKAAEERQKLAASVFENAREGIMITDPQGEIVEVNATFSDLTGYSRDEALGKHAAFLASGHHDTNFYRSMWEAVKSVGHWRGEIWNRKKNGEIFAELLTISAVHNPQGKISHMVGLFSDITRQKEKQQELERLAHYDVLTQLPNRMLLADRISLSMAQTLRSGKMLGVCYLDLDEFKPVNDRYGHAIGDQLLIEVAHRLKGCVRAGDTVSRLGGDEFVLLLNDLADDEECNSALERIVAALAQDFQVAGHEIRVSASLGVTLYPRDDTNAEHLLHHADEAMYQAKDEGRNRYRIYTPSG